MGRDVGHKGIVNSIATRCVSCYIGYLLLAALLFSWPRSISAELRFDYLIYIQCWSKTISIRRGEKSGS